MKFSTIFSVALVVLPAVSASLIPRQNNGQRTRGGQRGAKNAGNTAANNASQTKGNNGQNANNSTAVAGGQTGANNATAAADTGANNGAAGSANNGGGGAAAAAGQSNGDPQKSLTLDPKVIAPGLAQNGQDPPVVGQVASATSTNNFINFCLTVNSPITNGQQLQGGSCNPVPIGVIPSIDKMPSAKFAFPANNAVIPADQAFTFKLNIANLATGQFVNAQKNYFAAPQVLDASGVISGHSHITCDKLTAIDQTTVTDPQKFAFFKGLNDAAQGGVLTAVVDKGLPAGAYRCCTINSCANHQPVIAPVAQHGSLDDCSYFSTTAGGAGNAGAAAAGNAGAAAAAGAGTGNASASANTVAAATATAKSGGKGAGAGVNTEANAAATAAASAKPTVAGTGAAGGAKAPAGANNVGGRPRGGRPRRDRS